MACLSGRLGRLGVDWRDADGKRRWKSFRDEVTARQFLAGLLEAEEKRQREKTKKTGTTVAEYSQRWLAVVAVRVRPTSLARYRFLLDRQILPRFGLERIYDITQPQIRDWLAQSVAGGKFARSTAQGCANVLQQIFDQAMEDGLVVKNPTKGVVKKLRLSSDPRVKKVKALTEPQLRTLLVTIDSQFPGQYPLFLTLAMTGLRLGEALGLQWEDIDWTTRELNIERQVREDGQIAPPKSPRSHRKVAIPMGVVGQLKALQSKRREQGLASGMGREPKWVFEPWWQDPTLVQVTQSRNAVRYAMRRACMHAGLPHHAPHDLRHTFASLHLSRGESIKWVMEQLGHDHISTTMNTYGRWIPSENSTAPDALERAIVGE